MKHLRDTYTKHLLRAISRTKVADIRKWYIKRLGLHLSGQLPPPNPAHTNRDALRSLASL